MNDIIQLEKELHSFECRKSVQRLDELLSEDYLEIGTSGKTYNKQDQLEKLPAAEDINIMSSDFEAREIANNIVQISYQTNINDVNSKRSSLWRKEGESWRMIFHQSTRLSQ